MNSSALNIASDLSPESMMLLAKSTAHYPGVLFHLHLRNDGTYCIPFASAGIERVFGLKPEDVAQDAEPLILRIHPDERPGVLEYAQHSAHSLTTWNKEYRVCDPDVTVRWVGGSLQPERLPDGSTLWRGYVEDITERKATETALRRNAELPALLSETAADFINLPLSEVEGAIQASLSRIAAFLGVDRAYIFAYDFERGITINTFEWCAPGIRACIDELQATPLEMTAEWVECHLSGKAMYLPDVPGLPPCTMRDVLEPQDIKSLIAVPMLRGSDCVGFVGFDSVSHYRNYTIEEQHLLDVFARMLVNVQLRLADQAALSRSEQRFADAIEAAGEFVWEVDADWRVTYMSACAEELFDRPIHSLRGAHLADLIAGGERDAAILETFANATRAALPFCKLPTQRVGAGGIIIYFLSNSRPVLSADGRLLGHIGMSWDITKEKEMGRQLSTARAQVEIFFEASNDLLAIFTPDGYFVRASRSWSRLLGYSIEHLGGRRFIDSLHPDDTAAAMNVFQALLRGEIVTGYTNRYRHSHGDYRQLEWWAQSINGLVYASARDVTHAKEAEQSLARALGQERATAEMKGRLISMASHEFRTPLTLIRTRAELIALKLPNLDENTMRERLSSIVEACSYLTDIVTDVLDYSTLGRASSIESSVEIELGSFLHDLVTGAEHGDPDNNRVQLFMSAPSVRLLTFASLLRRAIGNVVENALKYSPPESQVLVSCRSNGDGVEVEIADQGIGIPEHIGSNLFNPFYRAPNVGNIRGTGLGLAVCKEAMDRLGGTITYDPNPTGGSIFTLRLPARPPATKHPS